jgi:hypothetical protein
MSEATWLDRREGGRTHYEPITTEVRYRIKKWLPVVQAAFLHIEIEPDRGSGEYTPFSERCMIGNKASELWLTQLKQLREDAYATCRHHVMQSIATYLAAKHLNASANGTLKIFQPDGAPPREYMDDTDLERPTPTVCYFLRWEWRFGSTLKDNLTQSRAALPYGEALTEATQQASARDAAERRLTLDI